MKRFYLIVFILLAANVTKGQIAVSTDYNQQRGESSLGLLAAPKDGIAYHNIKVKARSLVSEQKYVEAELLVERLVREYPRDGENWVLLATTKRGLKKHAEAASAFEKAGSLIGWQTPMRNSPYNVGYNAAASHLAAGNKRAALDHLRKLVFNLPSLRREALYDWSEFASLRDDPEFREITGRPDSSAWTREEGWRRDIDHLYTAVKRINPDYRNQPFPAEFERRYQELKKKVTRLSDEEIYTGMKRMLAVLRQGHITLFPPAKNRHLPLHFYAFPEGIFVINANEEYKDLIGSRVLSIGNISIEAVLRRLAETRSVDGDMQHLWSVSDLGSAYNLKGIGAINVLDSVTLTVQLPKGDTRKLTLSTQTNTLAPRMDKFVAPRGITPPLFLRDLNQPHWEFQLPEHDALYIQFNQVINEKDETLPDFGKRMRSVIAEKRPRNIILDVRHNNGGNDSLLLEFVRTLTGFSQTPDNQLYVLIGRRTYSAAATFITQLEWLTDPIFVGEASSECCNFYGVPSGVILPYSKIEGELTSTKANVGFSPYVGFNPWDARREMSPHVPVQLTAKAYFAGEDPVLETVFRLIALAKGK